MCHLCLIHGVSSLLQTDLMFSSAVVYHLFSGCLGHMLPAHHDLCDLLHLFPLHFATFCFSHAPSLFSQVKNMFTISLVFFLNFPAVLGFLCAN